MRKAKQESNEKDETRMKRERRNKNQITKLKQ
jgi:hypothetical protein